MAYVSNMPVALLIICVIFSEKIAEHLIEHADYEKEENKEKVFEITFLFQDFSRNFCFFQQLFLCNFSSVSPIK